MNEESLFVIPFAEMVAPEGVRIVSPRLAQQGPEYRCPECREIVALHKPALDAAGEVVRRKHFAHTGAPGGSCRGGTGESDQHRTAKRLLAQRLGDVAAGSARPPSFRHTCTGCGSVSTEPLQKLTSAVVDGPVAGFVADVLTFEGGKPRGACEVLVSSPMSPEKRAAYGRSLVWWAEVRAESVLAGADVWDTTAASWLRRCEVCEARQLASAESRQAATTADALRRWLAAHPHTKDCRCHVCWSQADASSGVKRNAPGGDVEASRLRRQVAP